MRSSTCAARSQRAVKRSGHNPSTRRSSRSPSRADELTNRRALGAFQPRSDDLPELLPRLPCPARLVLVAAITGVDRVRAYPRATLGDAAASVRVRRCAARQTATPRCVHRHRGVLNGIEARIPMALVTRSATDRKNGPKRSNTNRAKKPRHGTAFRTEGKEPGWGRPSSRRRVGARRRRGGTAGRGGRRDRQSIHHSLLPRRRADQGPEEPNEGAAHGGR